MIDRKLNYGRHIIDTFARKIKNYNIVLDIGAGNGDDLMIFRKYKTNCKLLALEFHEQYVDRLQSFGINT